jgi:hypothetical protein
MLRSLPRGSVRHEDRVPRKGSCLKHDIGLREPAGGARGAVNALIDEARASGFLQSAIERGGAIGVAVAPAGVKAGCPG